MSNHRRFRTEPGSCRLLGVHKEREGCNFAVAVPDGQEASLLLYRKGGKEPVEEIPLPVEERVGVVASVFFPEFDPEKYEYNYRIAGQVVQDPCATQLHGLEHFGKEPDWEDPHSIRCGILPYGDYDWEGLEPLHIPYEDMILYKVHVRGYTKQASVSHKGTFAGLQEMIPYFKELGINALELMPAYEFLELPGKKEPQGLVTTRQEKDRVNFWGYKEGFYFAPKRSYCAGKDPAKEMKDLVKALHKAGIECIMEFYFPDQVNPLMVLDALRYWRMEYRMDGFHLIGEGVPGELILKDGILCTSKLMLSGFDSERIYGGKVLTYRNVAEYNQGFLQDMRRFLKSDEDSVSAAVYRVRRNPSSYGVINYMVCQDGFTMNDLVSYDYRHNEDNGEDNQDGCAYNFSWNCGVEGPARKKSVVAVRNRQMRNAFLMMLLGQGTPMIYGGDEIANSQNGNNNAWCQDNPIGWVNWKNKKKYKELVEFVKKAIAFRKEHPILHTRGELKGMDYLALGYPDVSLHSQRAWYTHFDNVCRCVGMMYSEAYAQEGREELLYVAYNFHWEPRLLALPNLPEGMKWQVVLDTFSPEGFLEEPREAEEEKTITVQPRTIMVLLGKQE